MLRRSRALICILIAIVASYAYAQLLELRTGQWDFTLNLTGSLGDASELPPALRAQLEEQLRQPINYQSCLTAEDIEELNIGSPDGDEDCEVTSREVTGNAVDITRVCSDGDDERTETMHLEAASRESIEATVNSESANGPASMTITGTWISATCEDDD
jgi:hypothetical protein